MRFDLLQNMTVSRMRICGAPRVGPTLPLSRISLAWIRSARPKACPTSRNLE